LGSAFKRKRDNVLQAYVVTVATLPRRDDQCRIVKVAPPNRTNLCSVENSPHLAQK